MVACPTCSEVFFSADEAEFTHCANPDCSNSWICSNCAESCEACAEAFCVDCISSVDDPFSTDEDLDPRCCAACAKTIEFVRSPIPAYRETRIAARAKGQVA